LRQHPPPARRRPRGSERARVSIGNVPATDRDGSRVVAVISNVEEPPILPDADPLPSPVVL